MKTYLIERYKLFKANLIFTIQSDLAYWANNWGNIVSGVAFTLSTILFINVIFANVKSLAGYNKDQMLLLLLVSQINFYLTCIFSLQNIRSLVESVNTGQLDLILTKPIPALFYTSFKIIDLYAVLRDYSTSVITLVLVIDWANLNINPKNLLLGVIFIICGYIISDVVHFLSALPVFWFGDSGSTIDVFYYLQFDFITSIPFEGFSKTLQVLFIYGIPFLISSGLAVSVILGFVDGIVLLPLIIFITIISLVIKFFALRLALRNYTSASS